MIDQNIKIVQHQILQYCNGATSNSTTLESATSNIATLKW